MLAYTHFILKYFIVNIVFGVNTPALGFLLVQVTYSISTVVGGVWPYFTSREYEEQATKSLETNDEMSSSADTTRISDSLDIIGVRVVLSVLSS